MGMQREGEEGGWAEQPVDARTRNFVMNQYLPCMVCKWHFQLRSACGLRG